MKAYVVGTHLNCLEKLTQFKSVLTCAFMKEIKKKKKKYCIGILNTSLMKSSVDLSLTLKTSRKSASENVVCLCRLLNILANFQTYFCTQANSVDPGQTAPKGAV